MGKQEKANNEMIILEMKDELSRLRADLKSFIEDSNRQYMENILRSVKNDYSNLIITHLLNDAGDRLEENMIRDCEMHQECYSKFTGLLQSNASLINKNNVSKEDVMNNKKTLEDLQSIAPFKKCTKCFSEAFNLFSKQVSIMNSMHIYNERQDHFIDIREMPDTVVSELVEPLANKQRLEILKALCLEAHSFSSLSDITGLRGGNLLFHLQKLIDTGMILQVHERGDYLISDKGFKVVQGLSKLHCLLNQPEQQICLPSETIESST